MARTAVTAIWGDVTDELSMAALFAEASWSFGGVDICVSNAGIASAARLRTRAWKSGAATSMFSPPDTFSSAASA
jgi:NAD(P)-dependent dehydrogenase (short-subunit alcohol dehydrogenase family)